MKNRMVISSNVLASIFIGVILIYVSAMAIMSSYTSGSAQTPYPVANNMDIGPVVPESLPHYVYKRLKDSISNVQNNKDNGIGSGASIGIFSYYNTFRCEGCSRLFDNTSGKQYNEKVLELRGWTLKKASYIDVYNPVYYIEHNQSYIRKAILNHTSTKFYYSNEQVPFRYNNKNAALRIPIKGALGAVLQVFFSYILLGLCIIIGFYILNQFLKFLIDVSRGQIFSDKNISRVKFIGFSLFLFPVVQFLINLAMPLLFYNFFTNDLVLSEHAWKGHTSTFLVSLVFLLFYRALKEGKRLKEEQELTI